MPGTVVSGNPPSNSTHVATADVPKAIPDNNSTGVTSNLPLSGAGNLGTVTVLLNISHPYKGDLVVTAIAPNNAQVVLHNRTGGSADNVNKTVTLNLSTEALNGIWKLRVNDNAAGDVGYINSWSVTF